MSPGRSREKGVTGVAVGLQPHRTGRGCPTDAGYRLPGDAIFDVVEQTLGHERVFVQVHQVWGLREEGSGQRRRGRVPALPAAPPPWGALPPPGPHLHTTSTHTKGYRPAPPVRLPDGPKSPAWAEPSLSPTETSGSPGPRLCFPRPPLRPPASLSHFPSACRWPRVESASGRWVRGPHFPPLFPARVS